MTAQLISAVTPATSQPSDTTSASVIGTTWRRIRAAVNEMNYATERLMDVRVP